MADNILTHVDVDSYYQISLENLENIHFKVDQTHVVVSLLSDWVTECQSCSFSPKQQRRVDLVLFLLMTLIKLLPQV